MRECKPQSAELWGYLNHPAEVGDIVFDTSTMTLSPVCPPQGAWTATALHGQAVLRQHPRPWHRKTVKPGADDTTIDSAQLSMLVAQGASLAEVAAACDRQPQACQ